MIFLIGHADAVRIHDRAAVGIELQSVLADAVDTLTVILARTDIQCRIKNHGAAVVGELDKTPEEIVAFLDQVILDHTRGAKLRFEEQGR